MILASAVGMGRLSGMVVLIALVGVLVVRAQRARAQASPAKPASKPAAARVIEQPVRYVDVPAEPEVERPGSVGPPGT